MKKLIVEIPVSNIALHIPYFLCTPIEGISENFGVVWFGVNIAYKDNCKDNWFKTPNLVTH